MKRNLEVFLEDINTTPPARAIAYIIAMMLAVVIFFTGWNLWGKRHADKSVARHACLMKQWMHYSPNPNRPIFRCLWLHGGVSEPVYKVKVARKLPDWKLLSSDRRTAPNIGDPIFAVVFAHWRIAKGFKRKRLVVIAVVHNGGPYSTGVKFIMHGNQPPRLKLVTPGSNSLYIEPIWPYAHSSATYNFRTIPLIAKPGEMIRVWPGRASRERPSQFTIRCQIGSRRRTIIGVYEKPHTVLLHWKKKVPHD